MSTATATMGDRLSRLDGRLKRQEPGDLPPLHEYSVSRILRAMAEGRAIDGLEAEVSQELCRHHPGANRGGSVRIPLVAPVRGLERRDLTTSTGSGALVAPVDFPRLVDLLRAKSLTQSLGVQLVDTMHGANYSLPRITAGATAYFVSEGNAGSESNAAVNQVTFTPHSMTAWTDVSRTLMKTSGGNARTIAIRDLMATLAVELDRVTLNGSGAGAEPEGIIPNAQVNIVALGTNGGAPTRAAMIAAEKVVGQSNADVGPLAWVSNAEVRAKMRATELGTDTGRFLWSDEGTILQWPAYVTANCPHTLSKGTATGTLSALILARWESITVGTWGSVDLLEDPYSLGSSGNLRLRVFLDCDVKPRHPEAVAVLKDVVTT